MATTTYKRLAMAYTAAAGTNTPQTLYTNAGTNAIVSTLVVCNTTAVAQTYRIAVHTATTYAVTPGYIAYESVVAANDSVFLTVGLTLDSANKYLLVSSSNTGVIFSAFGAEIS